MSLHKIVLLIALAACSRPAYGSAASSGAALPAPTSSMAPATAPVGAAPPSAGAWPTTPPATTSSSQQVLARVYSLTTANARGFAPVLVIPAKEMPPETYDRIVEDLSIMSRIIEKSLRDGSEQVYNAVGMAYGMYDGANTPYGHTLFLPSDGTGLRVLRSAGPRPRAIYIAGDGVVFSLQVDFPLLAPPETAEPNQTADRTDRVWAAAQRELLNPQAAAHVRTGVSQGMPYRPEAVENFRSTLMALLKYATNIRDLEPMSWLTILVQGPSTVAEQSQDPSGDQAVNLIGARPAGRTLLTLRAQKADIDQLAKGLLEPTEFQKRVQITTY